ncbi:MAG TPA: hypothetical protein VK850_14380 [Candidatus Binatia bacterium]|nr:hypothetical protein [Candidatus Binatia bacterium]
MAQAVLLFIALLASGCTTITHQRELSASDPDMIVKAPAEDDQVLRTLLDDRRTWIDPNSPF